MKVLENVKICSTYINCITEIQQILLQKCYKFVRVSGVDLRIIYRSIRMPVLNFSTDRVQKKNIDQPTKTASFLWVIRKWEDRRQAQGESKENASAKGKFSGWRGANKEACGDGKWLRTTLNDV